MATIKDVANHAGLSVSVVSKYLKTPGAVREDTRVRIEAAIKALNYRPSPAAQSLRTGSTRLLMAVYPMIFNPVFMSYVMAIQELAAAKGYNVLIVNEEHLHASLRDTKHHYMSPIGLADGIIYCMPNDKSAIADISRFALGKPQISSSRYAFLPGIPNVSWDNDYAICSLVRHLLDMGHQRIAFITTLPDDGRPNNRMTGYKRALAEAGIGFRPEYCYIKTPDNSNIRFGYQAMEHLMALPEPPTAVIGENDFVAVGCCHYAHEQGLHVPQDLAVAGMFDSPPAEILRPPLTTAPFPAVSMAERTVNIMVDALNSAVDLASLPQDIFIPSQPIIRRSTDPSQPPFIVPNYKRKF